MKERFHRRLMIEELEPRTAPSASPTDIWNALDLPQGVAVSYSGDTVAVHSRVLFHSGGLLGFPSGRDEDFLFLSTGDASWVDTVPDISGDQGTDLGEEGVEGDTAIISFSLPVPASSTPQKLKFDFMFLSEEYPEWVGSQFNDFFTATVNGTNIAFDEYGNPVSVNNVFFTGAAATGTFFDGRSSMLTATYNIPSGTTTLDIVLSIGDVGDGIYDSAVILDNFRIEASQIVFLNFDGQSVTMDGVTWNQPAFTVTDIGYTAGTPRATIIGNIVDMVEAHYTGLDITFVTTEPTSGDFTRVVIGGPDNPLNSNPNSTLFGKAQSVDIGNRIYNDVAVVFSQEFGNFYGGAPYNESADTIAQRLAVTISHELAHNLGLRHVDNAYPEDIMKKNSPRNPDAVFGNTLLPLPASELPFWPDDAQRQNDQLYLKGILGTKSGGSWLSGSWNWLFDLVYKWFTLDLGSKTIYDVQIGTAGGGGGDGIDDDVGAQIFTFDSLSGYQQILLPNFSGSDKFFLIGASKPGGPKDITSGALNAQGQVDWQSALTDWVADTQGTLITDFTLYKVKGTQLSPFTTIAVDPSQYKDVTWLQKGKGQFEDADGDIYTVQLSGPGQVAVVLDDPDEDGKGPIAGILLQNTDCAKSSLTVNVKKGANGDGIVDIGAVQGSGLKSFTAKKSDLVGGGIMLTGGDLIGTLALNNIENGADVLLPGGVCGGKPASVSITASTIGDGTNIAIGASLKNFAANQITGATVSAAGIAGIGTMNVKGNAEEVDIRATTGGIKTLQFNGDLIDTMIRANGADGIGTMNVKGDADGIDIFTLLGGIKTLQLNGNLTDAYIDVDGAAGIGTANIKGNVTDLGLDSNGTIKTLQVNGSVTGDCEIFAYAMGKVQIQGDLGSDTSDIFVELWKDTTCQGNEKVAKPALENLTVKGWVKNTILDSAGHIGTVSIGAVANSTLFAGVNSDDYDQLPSVFTPASQYFDVQAIIKSFTITGIKGVTRGSGGVLDRMSNCFIAAYQIDKISGGYANWDNDGTPYGVVTAVLKSGTYTDEDGKWTWDPNDGPGEYELDGDAVLRVLA